MEKEKTKTVKAPGALTEQKAKEYAINDLKVSIGFLEFILREPEVIQLVAKKMLVLQEQLNKKQPKPTEDARTRP